jgi:hypothetical protein
MSRTLLCRNYISFKNRFGKESRLIRRATDRSTCILPYDSFPPKWSFILNFKAQIDTEYFTIYRNYICLV